MYPRFAAAICLATLAFGQRKPVTLAALQEFRARPRDPVPGNPVWSPKGDMFAYTQGKSLMLYRIADRSARKILDLDSMDSAAVRVPASATYTWENRRVDESSLQWSASSESLLYSTEGDLFLIEAATGKWRQISKTPVAERDPKIAPDGKKVAFRRNWDLYTLDLANGQEKQITTGGTDLLRNGGLDWVYPEELNLGTAYWWSPDSNSIAYLQFDLKDEPLYPHADLRGRRAVAEPQRYPQAGEPNPTVRLARVSVNGGPPQWYDLGDTARRSLIARVGWTRDSRKIWVVRTNRIQNQLEFLTFDASSGKESIVYQESDPYWVNVEGEPFFLPNNREVLWTSERTGLRQIYRFSFENGGLKQIVDTDVVTNIVCVNDDRVYFTSHRGALEQVLNAVRLDGEKINNLEYLRITKEAGTHRISMAPGCGHFLDTYSSLTTPPETTLNDAQGRELAIFRPVDRRAMEEFDLRPVEMLSFPNSDGVTLYASLIKPPNFDPAKKYPVIVNVYGGPHAQAVRNSWPGMTLDQVFAHKGFLVWQVDNRGTAGRGHKFESPVFRRLGEVELADQRDGLKYLLSLGFADSARVGVTGWSYGGFMTLNMLLNASDMFHAGFAGAPVTNWLNYDTIYTERYMGLPEDNAKAYASTSLPPKAANLKGKLMIAHNLEDDNVLFQNTVQMIEALENAGEHFELSLHTQKTHGVGGAAARQMEAAMLDFFERSLLGAMDQKQPR